MQSFSSISLRIPKNLSSQTGKVVHWRSSNAATEEVPSRVSRRGQMDSMTDALYDFSSGTAGALPLYDTMEATSAHEQVCCTDFYGHIW